MQMKSALNKLLKVELNLKSSEDLLSKIESLQNLFFNYNFSIDKSSYFKMIKSLIHSINIDGAEYSEYMSMAREGSILGGGFTSSSVGAIKKQYMANRKKLLNHARSFVD